GRTFIHPTQLLREQGIQLKLNPLTDILRGKSVVVVDDSIVRGNTSRKLVKMLKNCGVKAIHFRISSAQVKHPCFYGIDMSSREELIANKMDVEALTKWLEVDSLVYLSTDDMLDISGNPTSCMACFTGDYPAGVPLLTEGSLGGI
ncbi:MAG: amidophosphoribosyltransferase, partial [Cyanobacteria bacterium]|nr:amidophosphoribosyltransferase [Cyanobacteriota bacterium]